MNFTIYLLLGLTIVAAAKANPTCPYRATVDLTNQSKYENGSYVYQGVLIPPEKQFFYDNHYQFLYRKVSVPVHLRGCVCNARKRCIKLCCEKYELFNEDTYQCERTSKDMNINWELPMQLSNGTEELTNVLDKFIYQIGVPCPNPEALISDNDKWVLMENGEIFVELEQVYLDTVSYCLSPSKNTQEYSLVAYSCPIANQLTFSLLLNTFGLALSIIFLIPTIVVYMILKELRGDLRGKMIICYLLSLTIAYSTISFINISEIVFEYTMCSLLAYISYFFFMAAFLWLNVLCYDIWCKLQENNVEVIARENKKRFICYSLYAWSWSSIFTLLTIWADHSNTIDDLYKPGVGTEKCWVDTSKWSAAIYFYGPNLIISIFNLITFAYLTVYIYIVRRGSAQITHKRRSCQENANVILRLFLILGVPLFLDMLSYFLPDTVPYMFVITDLINAVQGVLMFTLFVLNPNVWDSLKKIYK